MLSKRLLDESLAGLRREALYLAGRWDDTLHMTVKAPDSHTGLRSCPFHTLVTLTGTLQRAAEAG